MGEDDKEGVTMKMIDSNKGGVLGIIGLVVVVIVVVVLFFRYVV